MQALPPRDEGPRPAASSCGACGLADRCAATAPRARGPLRGAPLVVASLLHFMVPALLALTGAAIAGGSAMRQLCGGLTGLLLGMMVATAVARRYADSIDREACFEPR